MMRVPCSLFAAASAILFCLSPAFAQDSGVSVETSRSLYEPSEAVKATVTNNRKQAIFIGGCGAVAAQRLEDEMYRTVVEAPCVTEGRAVQIAPGESVSFELKGGGKSGEVRRLSVAFGWGCQDARPLSQARCKEFATGVSASYRVGRRRQSDRK
jgi:hypothetical protein